jgi:hypothetical protein
VRRRASAVLPAAVVLSAAVLLSSCSRTSYEGVDLARYVPRESVPAVIASLKLAGDNATELLAAITKADESDRPALAFLVSNLPPVDLANADRSFLLDTVRLAREARDRFPWGATIPEDVYLAYVVPPRVSQEPLENARPYLFDELEKRLAGVTSMEEAALEVNRWCGEQAGFKPTARRDQGVFETLASRYGRCEELMILHVAALRSVAIPARETWTPYWATTDNNHAWTELWVGGGWHYAGACEPADALDVAWFSEAVKGAAIVLSSVMGPPAASDEVYVTRDRYSLVNSTSHYLIPGVLEVNVRRDRGPREGTPVTVSVWNFGALRRIARQETDDEGKIRLSLGDGEYFVCAGGPEGHDWDLAVIRSGEETPLWLSLDKDRPFDREFRLEYESTGD